MITGANAGVGFETTLELARENVKVIMACRNLHKAEAARQKILDQIPAAELQVLQLDISEPDSIASFTREFVEQVGELDLLINNAGIVGKELQRNSVGQEMQIATNYLGCFSLTGQLMPYFRKETPTRILNIGSLAHRFGKLALDDFNWEHSAYNGWKGYARSKIATMTYTVELNRRLQLAGSTTVALGAHPGFALTDIAHKTGALSTQNPVIAWLQKNMMQMIPTPAEAARTILWAACSDTVQGGDYYGPGGFMEIAGTPAKAKINPVALEPENGSRLWALSEEMTGTRYLS